MTKEMNFEKLSSKPSKVLLADEGESADTMAQPSRHSLLKKSFSRKAIGMPLMKKAASIRNVMLRISSSEDGTSLLKSSSDEIDIGELTEEFQDATEFSSFLENDLDDLFQGQFDDADISSSCTPSNSEELVKDFGSERSSATGGVSRRRRNGRSSHTRRLGGGGGDSLSSSIHSEGMKSPLSLSDHSSGRRSHGRLSRQQLVTQPPQRRTPRPRRRRIAENPSESKNTLRNLEVALNPQLST